MQQTHELASERTRSHLELAAQIRDGRKLRALNRARRNERRAERRMLAAWRARHAIETAIGIE
jgi:hypothetical protein